MRVYIVCMHSCITVITAVHKGAVELEFNVCYWMVCIGNQTPCFKHVDYRRMLTVIAPFAIVLRIQSIHKNACSLWQSPVSLKIKLEARSI